MTFETFTTGTNWEVEADFSQVARIPSDKDIIITSGQVAYDADATIIGVDDIEAQTHKAFQNLKQTLEAAGSSLEHAVKLRYSVTDQAYYDAIKKIRPEYLTEPYPTGMLAVVDGLAEPELLIEIEAIAVGLE